MDHQLNMPCTWFEDCPPVVRNRPQVVVAILCVLALITVIIIYLQISSANVKESEGRRYYTLVIDAGSTSTKIFGYVFYKDPTNGSLVLDKDELDAKVKKGLADSVDDPKQGVKTVSELLVKAEEFVPKELWSSTPLVLRATAGFRKLPQEKIQNIFNEVVKVFAETQFYKPNNSVAMLSGDDEGLFGWVAVNFLLDNLHRKVTEMSATLDLGGVSTQVTFPLADKGLKHLIPRNYLHTMTLLGQELYLYSHSYMGMGLKESKHKILTMGNPEGATDLTSECVNPGDNGTVLDADGVKYTVYSPASFQSDKCERLVKEYVASSHISKPLGALQFKIFAFAGFYYTAKDAGLMGKEAEQTTFTLKQLEDRRRTICNLPKTHWPLLCLEVMYVSTLLIDGYGFPAETNITVTQKLNGHTINWALGVASQIVQDQV